MPRDNIVLQCTDCKSRNYVTTKNKKTMTDRLEEFRTATSSFPSPLKSPTAIQHGLPKMGLPGPARNWARS